MEPPVSLAVAARQRRAATADAEPPDEPPGVRRPRLPEPSAARALSRLQFGRQPGRSDGSVIGRLVRRAHGELVHIELAQHHRAVAPQIRGDGRFVGRPEAVENMAARLGMDPFGGVKILDRRSAIPRAARPLPGEAGVAGLSHLQRLVRGDSDKRVEPLGALDRLEMSLGDLEAGNRSRLETIARLGERQRGQVGQIGSLKTGCRP